MLPGPDDADYERAIVAADCVLCLRSGSVGETNGPLLDALGAGRAVLATKTGSIPEVAGDAVDYCDGTEAGICAGLTALADPGVHLGRRPHRLGALARVGARPRLPGGECAPMAHSPPPLGPAPAGFWRGERGQPGVICRPAPAGHIAVPPIAGTGSQWLPRSGWRDRRGPAGEVLLVHRLGVGCLADGAPALSDPPPLTPDRADTLPERADPTVTTGIPLRFSRAMPSISSSRNGTQA